MTSSLFQRTVQPLSHDPLENKEHAIKRKQYLQITHNMLSHPIENEVDDIIPNEPAVVAAPEESVMDEALKAIVAKRQAEYYRDTIAKAVSDDKVTAKTELANKSEPAAFSLWSWIKSFFTTAEKTAADAEIKEEEESQQEAKPADLPAHLFFPHLAPLVDSKKEMEESFRELVGEINQREKDRAEKSKELAGQYHSLHHLNNALLVQREIRSNETLLSHDEIKHLHGRNKKIRKEYYDLTEEIEKHRKTESTLKWVNVGQTVGLIGIIALSFATGGAGGVLLGAQSALAISIGATEITKGFISKLANEKSADLIMANHSIKNHTDKVSRQLNTMSLSTTNLFDLWKIMRRANKDADQAIKRIIK
jgi:hypothetical protein